jgi:hypothetical protein
VQTVPQWVKVVSLSVDEDGASVGARGAIVDEDGASVDGDGASVGEGVVDDDSAVTRSPQRFPGHPSVHNGLLAQGAVASSCCVW